MLKRSSKYQDFLIDLLKNPKEAAAYLNAVIQDTRDDSEESKKLLLLALRNIAEAQGGSYHV
jgi:DNA-binding phage protein